VTYFCYEDAVTRDDRGIEAAARSLRYALLHECAIDHGADYVATAHTASDQLESFFVDLLTGTSVFTLGGIAGSCEYISDDIKLVGDVRLIRPLLDVSTDMVNEYLAAKGLAAVYDSTNSDTRYVRNFVRTKLLPALDTRTDALKATVASIQEESRLLADYFDRQTAHFVSLPAEGGVIISRAQLDSAELVLQRYILGKWVSILARGGAMHVCAILRQLQEPRSVRIDLPQGHFCEITPRAVRIFDRSLVQPFEYAAAEAYGLSEHVRASAEIVRSRQNGDRYRGKKLKDLFEQRKLDLYERDRAMVAVAMGEIIWVEHIDG
jgi:tRNA(Ile)-lysidine synthase